MRKVFGSVLPGVVVAALAASPVLAKPMISNVEPTAAFHGESVTVRGHGFGAHNVKIAVGGVPAQVIHGTGNAATFFVPEAAPFGLTVVTVTNPGGHTTAADFRVLFDGRASLQLDTSATSTAIIGPAGGTIEADWLRLDVPAGALPQDVEITMTPLATIAASPLDRGFVGGARFEPEGLGFFNFATLTVFLPEQLPPGQLVAFATHGDGSEMHLTPSIAAVGAVEIPVWHFSASGAAAADPTELDAALAYEPTAAHEIAEQELAAADAAYIRALENDDPSAETDFSAALVAALERWYRSSVRLGWQSVGGSMEFFELAASEWVAWLAFIPDDTSALNDEKTEAEALALDAAADLAGRVLSRCDGNELPDELRDATRLATVLLLIPPLPLETRTEDGTPSGRPLPDARDLLSACVHVELQEFSHPRALAANFDNPFAVRAAAIFWNGEPRTDIELLFRRLDRTGGAQIVVDSAQVTGGLWEATVDPGGVAAGSVRIFNLDVDAQIATGTAELLPTALSGQASAGLAVRQRIELMGKRQNDSEFQFDFPRIAPGETVELRVRLAGPDVGQRAVAYSLAAGAGSLSDVAGVTGAFGESFFQYVAPDEGGGEAIVTASIDDDGAVRSASFAISVLEPIVVTVTPAQATLLPGATLQFAATVSGPTSSGGVTWNATGGTISAGGVYTAGSTPGSFFVTATSVDDPDSTAGSVVEIRDSLDVAGEYRGTATDSRFPNALNPTPPVRVYVLELGVGAFRVTFHFDYRIDLGRGRFIIVYQTTIDGHTLSGTGPFGPLGNTVEFIATVSGDTLAGRAYYWVPPPPFQPQCPADGCYFEFDASRFP